MSVLGVDGCKHGWLCVHEGAQGDLRAFVAPTVADALRQIPDLRCAAVDIPIGLADNRPRGVDAEARKLLGKRASSVFPAPVRPVLAAATYAEACTISQAARGKKLSQQSWAIVPKIRAVDELLRSDARARALVKEVHPEVCFFAWNRDVPMREAKKHPDGSAERRALVEGAWPGAWDRAISQLGRVRYGPDDLADAFAALWTGRRIVSGRAWRIPDLPETDSQGLPMEMWA